MNLAIKIILKTLMTKISRISWGDYNKGGYDKGFYGSVKLQMRNNITGNQQYTSDDLKRFLFNFHY